MDVDEDGESCSLRTICGCVDVQIETILCTRSADVAGPLVSSK